MTKSLPPCHHSLLFGNFYPSHSLYTFMFSLMSFTFDFSNHFHFSILTTKSLPPCHHSLLIGNFHFSESISRFQFCLFTFDFTNHFHFSIPMTQSLPPCHHLQLIGSFHLSESLFTFTFTFSLFTFDFTYQLRLMMWIVFCNGTVFFLTTQTQVPQSKKTERISRLSRR